MALNFKQFFEGIRVKAKAILTSDTKGELEVLTTDGKIYYHNGTIRSPLITEAGSVVITNKDLVDSTTNIVDVSDPTKRINFDAAGTTGTRTTLLSSQTTNKTLTLPDATDTLVGKTTTDTLTNKTLTTPVINSPTGIVKADVGLANVDNTSDATKNAATVTLTNHSIDASLNTITNITNTEISASAAIARSKLASGTNNALVNNSSSGVLSESTDITLGTNNFTLANTKHIELQASTDTTTTGSNASLAAFTAGGVRLTNVSLTSLANIPAGANGQQFVLFNRTGVIVAIKDSSGAIGTAANRILTGTSADINMSIDSALVFNYDSATTRWQIVGGSGGSVNLTGAITSVGSVTSLGSFTSANLSGALTDETGSGLAVFNTSPTLVTPALGTPSALIGTNITGTATAFTASNVTTNANLTGDVTSVGNATTYSGTVSLNKGGTGQTTKAPAFDALQPMTTGGDLIYGGASGTGTRLANGTQGQILTSNGSTNAPLWLTPAFPSPNYILNPNAEVNTTGWATYADAAGVSPVDGTGGSPVLTFARTTSSPLRGVGSFLITKDAANRQGNGVSYDLTIDSSDQGKVLQGSFEYQIASGTFADNDISVWIYDITNAVLIQPAPYLIKNSGIIEKFAVEFQTAINSTSYRLIFHVASTSALAYTIKMDNFNIGPQAKLYGSAVTDFITTRTFTASAAFGTTTLSTFASKQVGDVMEVQGYFKLGTVAGSEANITLPNSIDSTKFSSTTAVTRIGTWTRIATGGSATISSTDREGAIFYDGSTSNKVYFAVSVAANIFTKANGTDILATSDGLSMMFRYPIAGTSSSQVMSADADTRALNARYHSATATVTASYSDVTFTTSEDDTHAIISGATATIPTPGKYNFSGQLFLAGTGALNTTVDVQLFKNGATSIAESQFVYAGAVTASVSIPFNFSGVPCIAGDTFKIQVKSGATLPVITASTTENYIQVTRNSGPAQIAASESVSALYTGAPPTGTLNGSFNMITFGTKVKDSHNAYSAGVYTIPMSGVYNIAATVKINGTYSLNQALEVAIFIDGNAAYEKYTIAGGANSSLNGDINAFSVPLLAGQQVTIRGAVGATSPVFSSASAPVNNFFSIVRSGNY